MAGHEAGGHYDDGYAQAGHGDAYYQDEHGHEQAQGYYDNQTYGDGYYDRAAAGGYAIPAMGT